MMADPARLELDPDPAEVSVARKFVLSILQGIPGDVVADAQLIASELVTNAIEHGVGGPVVIEIDCDDKSVNVRVESVGPAPHVGHPDEWRLASASQLSGRGLGITRKLADTVAVSRSSNRLVIDVSILR